MNFEPWVFLTVLLVSILVGIKGLHHYRATAMRALADRWGFHYSAGDTRILGKRKPVHYPTGFTIKCYPIYLVSRIWNLIEGERSGIRIVIFDSMIGEGKGARYCTLVATQTNENLFKIVGSREKIAQRSGWTAVYRIPFIGLPLWALSITRIESFLRNCVGERGQSPV